MKTVFVSLAISRGGLHFDTLKHCCGKNTEIELSVICVEIDAQDHMQ